MVPSLPDGLFIGKIRPIGFDVFPTCKIPTAQTRRREEKKEGESERESKKREKMKSRTEKLDSITTTA